MAGMARLVLGPFFTAGLSTSPAWSPDRGLLGIADAPSSYLPEPQKIGFAQPSD